MEMGDELGRIHWLAEEVGGTRLPQRLEHFDGAIAAEYDDGNLPAEAFAQFLNEDQAVQVGEVQVDDCGVKFELVDGSECVCGAVGDGCLITLGLQKAGERVGGRLMIVNHQNIRPFQRRNVLEVEVQ